VRFNNGSIRYTGQFGWLWTSSPTNIDKKEEWAPCTDQSNCAQVFRIAVDNTGPGAGYIGERANAYPVRCFKNTRNADMIDKSSMN
jgi:hypothetical protein